MQVPFRVYGDMGCPFCIKAEQFFQAAQVPAQMISVGKDPIALEGIRKVAGLKEGEGITIPAIVCVASEQVILGFKLEEMRNAVAVYHSMLRDGAFDLVAQGSGDPRPAPDVVNQETPTT